MPVPQFLPGETLPAAKLQQLGNEGSVYVPTLTATTTPPTLGTGPDQTSNIWLNGRLVFIWFTIRFGTGMTAGSGEYQVDLSTAYPLVTGEEERPIGTARLIDSSGSAERTDSCVALPPLNRIELRGVDGIVTNASPWVWPTATPSTARSTTSPTSEPDPVTLLPELAIAVILALGTTLQYRSGRHIEARLENLRTENRDDHRDTARRIEAVRTDINDVKARQAGHDQLHTNDRWKRR